MESSRRETITALGTAGVATVVGSLAIGEYVDDDRSRTGPGVAVADDEDDTDAGAIANGLAAVRIAHLSPATPTVDVTVDGEQLVSGVAVDEVSPYLQFEPGTYTVQFAATDDPETVLFEDEVSIETAYYTIAVTDDLESDGPTVVVDAGAALVRVVHASSIDGAIDVATRGGRHPLFENVAFGTATGYAPVPTGSYTLEVAMGTDDQAEEADETDETDDEAAETDAADASDSDDDTATDETDDASAADSEADTPPDDAGDDAGSDDAPEDSDDDTSIDEEEGVSEDIDSDDVPDDVDEEDVPDDVDPEDIPDDIDEDDIPDDVDPNDIPDNLSGAEFPDNASRRVDSDTHPDVSLLSTDETESVASIDVSLERGRAYTGYVIDRPEAETRQDSDRASLTVTVDGDGELGAADPVDESDESY